MKILVVVHALPGAGGVESVAIEQAQALCARGHELVVLTRSAQSGLGEGEWVDATYEGISVREVGHGVASPPSYRELYVNGAFTAALTDLLTNFAPDVVHIQHLVHLSLDIVSAVRAARVPVVVSLHDYFFLCDRLFLLDRDGARCAGPNEGEQCVACLADVCSPTDARWRFAAMREALSAADVLVAVSPSVATRFATELPELSDRIRVLEPGVPESPPAVRRAPRDAGKRLLFVGTWQPHKGLDLLLEALFELRDLDWELEVRGGGEEPTAAFFAALKERAADLPIRFLGRFADAEAAQIYADADVLVLPSRCEESWSRVVREARAAGCAVVAPALGGPADLLDDGRDALLVEPGSRAALEAALRRLLTEPGLREALASAPTHIVTTTAAAGELEDLFSSLAAAAR